MKHQRSFPVEKMSMAMLIVLELPENVHQKKVKIKTKQIYLSMCALIKNILRKNLGRN